MSMHLDLSNAGHDALCMMPKELCHLASNSSNSLSDETPLHTLRPAYWRRSRKRVKGIKWASSRGILVPSPKDW
jgi:hypothetical protein